MGKHTEILFVDGNSTDGTWAEIERMIAKYKDQKDIRVIQQVHPEEAKGDAALAASQRTGKMLPHGKGHAVRLGFQAAQGDVLMILDADLTVAPEDLPRFFEAIAQNKANLANGSRLVYPMATGAMRSLNLIGNKFFSLLFSWLLEQYVGDTLCGTKALRANAYHKIAAIRGMFGELDPFGDFDLLFGAGHLGMKIVDIPVHYGARTVGQPKIINLKHGPMLLRMSWIGFVKLKLPWWRHKIRLAWCGPPKATGTETVITSERSSKASGNGVHRQP
jgi:glycosyltransferase involved in cell wall biosynthesis